MDAERIGTFIDRQKVVSIQAGLTLPPEFGRLAVRYGPDQDGDASVSLEFLLDDAVSTVDEDIPRLSRFMTGVVNALYNGNIGGFAYSRLLEAA